MDEQTAAIKDAVDIVQLIGEYVVLRPAGKVHKGLCPFHEDKNPSLTVNPQYQSYKCWSCGAAGDIFTFVQNFDRITFVEAKERLAERAGITLPERVGRADDSKSTLAVLRWAEEEYQKSLWDERGGAVARQYLEARGLRPETAHEFRLGFAPPAFEWLLTRARRAGKDIETLKRAGLIKEGKFAGQFRDFFQARLLFSIRDERKRTLGFGGRVLPELVEGELPKYVNTPATDVYDKSGVLYGLDTAVEDLQKTKSADERFLVVMEGYTDCLMAYQAGFRRAVATCGTALTSKHIDKLRRYVNRVVLMFDGDQAGQKAAHQATRLFLSAEIDLRLCVLPDGLDPCDFVKARGIDELLGVISKAPDAIDFQIKQALALSAGSGIDGQFRALDSVVKLLAEVPTLAREGLRVRFDLALSRLGEAFGLSEVQLRRQIEEARQGETRRPVPARSAEEKARESIADVRMDRRERELVQAMVCHLGRLDEWMDLVRLEDIKHPWLARLASAAWSLYQEQKGNASQAGLRERLSDPNLDALFVELIESAPHGDAEETWVEDLKRSLKSRSRSAQADSTRKLASSNDASEHLEALRQLRDQWARR